jgi:hypothetical protein
VLKVIPEPTRAEKERALSTALASCWALGITSLDAIEGDVDSFHALRAVDSPIAISVYLPIEGDLDAYAKLPRDGRVRFAGVKGFIDGVIESRTALMLAPYSGPNPSGEKGTALLAREKLDPLLLHAKARGFRVKLHAIGDGAVRLALDAFEQSGFPRGMGAIEHIEALDPADAPRFARLGVVASMQPYHAIPGDGDPDTGAWSENLGAERLQRSFAWRALLDAGAELRFGSDWPVFTHNPLEGLAVATTRKNAKGLPGNGWNAHQAVTLDEALRAYASPVRATVTLAAGVDPAAPSTLWGAAPAEVRLGP